MTSLASRISSAAWGSSASTRLFLALIALDRTSNTPVCVCVCVSVCLSVCLSVSIYLSIYLYICIDRYRYLHLYMYAYLSIFLSIYIRTYKQTYRAAGRGRQYNTRGAQATKLVGRQYNTRRVQVTGLVDACRTIHGCGSAAEHVYVMYMCVYISCIYTYLYMCTGLVDACRTIHSVGAQLSEVGNPAQVRVHAGEEDRVDGGEACRRAHQHRRDDEADVTL